MKKLSIISATLIAAGMLYTGQNSVVAQDVTNKFSVGLNIGAGIPGGDFSKADGSALPVANASGADTSKFNGFAQTSFTFDVYATYMFSSHVGAMLSLGGTMNSFNATALQTSANTGGGSAVVTSSGSYFIQQYLVGPYVSLPLGSDKLQLELKGLVGYIGANYPTIDYAEGLGTGTIAVKSGSGFGYRFGLGLKYMVTDIIGLHLDAAYTGSSITYSSYTQTQSSVVGSQSEINNSPKTMSLSLIQVTVGLSFSL